MSYQATNAENAVNRLYSRCIMRGKESPFEAAYAIDSAIGGLTRVDYDPNKALRIYNHDLNVGISQKGLNKKQNKSLNELVVILHHIAETKPGGFDKTTVSSVNIGAKNGTVMSTKHHAPAYRRFQQKVLEKYAA
jgi:hypothetical protein